MPVWRIVFILITALALWSCAETGYVYDYDPLHGPRGHYTSPFEHPPQRAALDCQQYAFSGPYYGGWRGPYMAGPYCVQPVAQAAVAR